MTNYREILRLKSLGFSQRNIALSCSCSRNTVSKVIKKSEGLDIQWHQISSKTNAELEQDLFPSNRGNTPKRLPDFNYIRKELMKNGVNKKLLWSEYMEDCKLNGDDPLMYSQFCYHIQQDEQKRRASMHIKRKPGEQIEVDSAGDPSYIIDPDTGELTQVSIFVAADYFAETAPSIRDIAPPILLITPPMFF